MKKWIPMGVGVFLFTAGCGNHPASSSGRSSSSVAQAAETIEKSDSAPAAESKPVETQAEDEGGAKLTDATASASEGAPEPAPTAEPKPAEQTKEAVEPAKKPTELKGEPLDLTAYYHTPASAFDNIQKYPWRNAPRGDQIFGNVPLKIGGMICLWGARNAEGGLVFPYYLEAVPIQKKFEAIYLYHATFNNAEDGTPVSNLVFNFDDESYSSIEICCGIHLKDWLVNVSNPTELTDPKSKLVVRKKSSMSSPEMPRELRFYISEIANPEPSKTVTTIDLVSAKERSSYCLLAITTGPAGLLKIDSPPKTE